MDELVKKLSETNNSAWTVISENAREAISEGKSMLLDEGVVVNPRNENENTIAAVGELPDCAVLIITKENNLAALHTATELYASVKHFGHAANFLLLRGQDAQPEALADACREIVLKWQEDLPKK